MSLKSPERDKLITEQFLASEYAQANSFFVYVAMGSEVATTDIIAALLAQGKRVCVPRIINNDTMLAVPYGKLKAGRFGIPEPEAGEDTPCEVTLTPLIAFDGAGIRLGQGGGFYDRYFASHDTRKVGLAYAGQAAQSLPAAEWDIPLDAVITEEGVRHFKRKP